MWAMLYFYRHKESNKWFKWWKHFITTGLLSDAAGSLSAWALMMMMMMMIQENQASLILNALICTQVTHMEKHCVYS